MPIAEIIAIGTELLLGETTDTNTRFIARTLRELGVDLYRTQTIGDNAGRIAEAVREASSRAEIVITTGGLGPTVDDPTRQAIAEAARTELEFRPELWDQITARIGRYGHTPTENQKRQAYVPKGAMVIENPVGTAPAFIVELPSPLAPLPKSGEGNRVAIALPGVPREMETLLTEAVIPYLQKRFTLRQVLKVRTLHVSGVGEGTLDERIGDLETLANPTVGLAAHSGVVDIRIAAKADSQADASRLIETVEQDLRTRLGDDLFGADEATLEGVALEAVAARGWKLTTVENGLDGELERRLSHSGQPTYCGASSRPVRKETLAQVAVEIQQASAGMVVLGVCLTDSDQQQEVEIVTVAPNGHEQRHLRYGGHPKNASRWAVNNALDWLRRMIGESR